MIKGLRTVTYPVADLGRAKAWFADVFGVQPYFDQPFYVGFAIGGFELGLVPDGTPGTTGVKEKSVSSLLSRKPRPGTVIALPPVCSMVRV